jgi:hypothetical protein
VQGTIESETAQRDYLHTITDTVKVDVNYNGLIQQAGPFDVSPIRAALDGFAHTAIESFDEMINWIAYALPSAARGHGRLDGSAARPQALPLT